MIISSIPFLSPLLATGLSPVFMPHGFCYRWDPTVLWLNVVSDTLIALSYYCIPVVLIYFIRRNRTLPLNAVFWMFATFILACGTTHLLEVWNIWHANYLLAGLTKGLTAIVSVVTAAILIPLAPKVISVRERMQLQDTNRDLREEIAQRVRVEQALRVAQDSMSGIIASAMDSIIIIDEAHNILVFNAAAEKMFRCSAGEVLGQPIERFLPHRFRAAHPEHIRQFAKTGVTSRAMGELRALWAMRADGEQFQIEASISQVESADKKLFTVILRDVTERVQATLARERLAAVVDSSDDAIITKTLDGIITAWNRGAEKVFGYSSAEAVGKSMKMMIPPERTEEESKTVSRILRGQTVEPFDTVRIRKDGRSIDVSVTISPIRDGTGAIVGASKIARDISYRKQAEERLRESEERFQVMVNGIPQLAWMADPDGHLFWYNQRWYDYTGTTLRQMEGWGWQSVHDPDVLPWVLQAWKDSIASGTAFDMEFPLRAANGAFGTFLTRITPLKDAQGRVVRWFGTSTDISERKRAEQQQAKLGLELARRAEELTHSREALEAQTVMFKQVLASMGEGLVAADQNGRFLLWNEAANKLMGRGSADIPPEQWTPHYKVFLPDGVTPYPADQLPLVRALHGESVQVELFVQPPDSTLGTFMEVTARPMKDPKGNLSGGVAVLRDINERKRTESALARQAQDLLHAQQTLETQTYLLQSVLDSISEGLIAANEKGELTIWNPAAAEIMGLGVPSVATSECNTHYNLYLTDGVTPLPPEQNPLTRAIGGEVSTAEIVVRKPGQEEGLRIDVSGSPLKAKDGLIRGGVVAFRDVTERRKAERLLANQAEDLSRQAEALRRSQQALETQTLMLESVLDSISEGLVVADEQGKFVVWNPAAERIVGLGPMDVPVSDWSSHYGLFMPDTVTPFPPDQNPLLRAILGEMCVADMFLRNAETPDGAWIEVSASPLKDKHGRLRGGVTAFRDITQRKRSELEILRLNNELESRVLERTAQLNAANQELEAFTYSVSHDLRAPLRHIAGFASLLLEESSAQLDPEAQHHLHRIHEGTRKMGQLVDELLNLARIGRQPTNLHLTELNSIVEEVTALLRPDWEGRAVQWNIAALPPLVCDPTLLKQVFQNLLSNSLKYSRTREHPVIEVGVTQVNEETVIFVRDNGVGFNMKYADKLFGVFQRLHRADEFEGTGVGLAIVQRIIKKHGGRVWAEAEPDKGATFYFTAGAATFADSKSRAASSGMGAGT